MLGGWAVLLTVWPALRSVVCLFFATLPRTVSYMRHQRSLAKIIFAADFSHGALTISLDSGRLLNMKNKGKICDGEDCSRPAVTRGVCMAHYMRARRAKQEAERGPVAKYERVPETCGVEVCSEPAVSKGMCRRHYNLAWRYGLSISQVNEYESATECPLCLRVRSEDKGLVVDHDHDCCPGNRSCGECVRGFICQGCNNALGRLDKEGAWDRFATYRGL